MSGVDRYEWERLVRRVQLGAPAKLVALTMATYADRDGSRVHPGVSRLALVTGLSERSVHGALKKLRDLGLVDQTQKGGRAGDGRAFASSYRLAVPANYLSLPGVLGVNEEVALNPQDVQVEAGSQPAPHDAQPAPGASQPAPHDAQPAPGAPHQPTYQPPTNPHTNRGLTSLPTSRPRATKKNSNVIPLERRAR